MTGIAANTANISTFNIKGVVMTDGMISLICGAINWGSSIFNGYTLLFLLSELSEQVLNKTD
ncbi:MAG: hypothetical protein Alis3KO_15890 [Aliiglaciecola sp.]